MKKLIILLVMCVVGWQLYQHYGQSHLADGVSAPHEPKQNNEQYLIKTMYDDYEIMSLASFNIKAKVLSKRKYDEDKGSEISPVDFAMGWGRMSDNSVLKDIKISQSGRFYRWSARKLPIPHNEISSHSANMHLIPANDAVRDALNNVEKHDTIEIKGNLVQVSSSDGYRWTSSLTRNDTGGGACEVIYVKSIQVVNP